MQYTVKILLCTSLTHIFHNWTGELINIVYWYQNKTLLMQNRRCLLDLEGMLVLCMITRTNLKKQHKTFSLYMRWVWDTSEDEIWRRRFRRMLEGESSRHFRGSFISSGRSWRNGNLSVQGRVHSVVVHMIN